MKNVCERQATDNLWSEKETWNSDCRSYKSKQKHTQADILWKHYTQQPDDLPNQRMILVWPVGLELTWFFVYGALVLNI